MLCGMRIDWRYGLSLGLLLVGCAKTPCALCYEDEWSREPFPGQPKQHLPTVDTRTPAER